jgi:hypothetical protein
LAVRLKSKQLDSVRLVSYTITTEKLSRDARSFAIWRARDALTALEKTGIEVVNPAQRP